MKLDKDLCVGCGSCVPYCPVGALSRRDGVVQLDPGRCVECHVCVRAAVCPTGALQQDELSWPRVIRSMFSDPFGKHPSTQHMGRGTEEVKTNDVTNLVTYGNVGIAVEPGRPGVSTSMRDVEKITMALAKAGVKFAPRTPVTSLMTDQKTGKLRDDILEERVLSAIVECVAPKDTLPQIARALREVSKEVDTVFSVAVFLPGGPAGDFPTPAYFGSLGLDATGWGKTNLGLGRATIGENTRTGGGAP